VGTFFLSFFFCVSFWAFLRGLTVPLPRLATKATRCVPLWRRHKSFFSPLMAFPPNSLSSLCHESYRRPLLVVPGVRESGALPFSPLLPLPTLQKTFFSLLLPGEYSLSVMNLCRSPPSLLVQITFFLPAPERSCIIRRLPTSALFFCFPRSSFDDRGRKSLGASPFLFFFSFLCVEEK